MFNKTSKICIHFSNEFTSTVGVSEIITLYPINNKILIRTLIIQNLNTVLFIWGCIEFLFLIQELASLINKITSDNLKLITYTK